jgi:nucleoside-diphosphate-sugar epimerase
MKKNVLVLGGTGFIGSRLCKQLEAGGWAKVVAASSRGGPGRLQLDTRDEAALRKALADVDAVVNCVAGNADAILRGAQVLASAIAHSGCRQLVHMSTMSVYGAAEGELTEDAPLDPGLGWYGQAKVQAEAVLAALAQDTGASVTLMRPGCVAGPGSDAWVGRIGRLLAAGRLGDLGAAGDGWSNLVHVDDVCQAILRALQSPPAPGTARAYNLAAPDSPRWNDYFADMALAIGATPLRRIHRRQLQVESRLLGPAFQVGRKLLDKLGRKAPALPDPISGGLLALWHRHLRMDASRATQELGLQWTPYPATLRQGARWFAPGEQHEREAARAGG